MAIKPKLLIPLPSQVEGAQSYTATHEDTIRNFGKGPLPEAMTGENIEHTAILPAEAGKKRVAYTSDSVGERTYEEPSIPFSGSNRSAVWQTRYGGCYIELSGRRDGEEFINLVHSSGARITIDQNGSIVIKSFGDTHNVTDGNISEMSTGSKTAVYEGGYTVHVQNGVCDIRSEGNMNISSGADMTISAAGKLTLNVGDALDLAAAKVAITSRIDTMDILSTGMMRLAGKSDLHIKSGANIFNESIGEMNVKSGANITTSADSSIFSKAGSLMGMQSGSKMSLLAGGVLAGDGSQVHLNSGLADGSASAVAAIVAFEAASPPEPIRGIFSENTAVASNPPISAASLDESRES